MATLNFIRGSIKGKVGQFVGSSWRGKNYIKTFTPPSNPKTAGQVAVRTIFQNVAHVAKAVYEGILKPYTFPRPRRCTAYNRMVQINKELFNDQIWDPAKLKIFEGPLFNPGITSAAVSNDEAVINFDIQGGEPGDKALAVVYDDASGTALYQEGLRSIGEVRVSITPIDPAARSGLHAYLVFAREPAQGTAEQGQVSGTAYKAVSP